MTRRFHFLLSTYYQLFRKNVNIDVHLDGLFRPAILSLPFHFLLGSINWLIVAHQKLGAKRALLYIEVNACNCDIMGRGECYHGPNFKYKEAS